MLQSMTKQTTSKLNQTKRYKNNQTYPNIHLSVILPVGIYCAYWQKKPSSIRIITIIATSSKQTADMNGGYLPVLITSHSQNCDKATPLTLDS